MVPKSGPFKAQASPQKKKFCKFFYFPAKQQFQKIYPLLNFFWSWGVGECLTRNNRWKKKIFLT